MPTRLYFPESTASPVNPSFTAGWSYNSEAVRRKLANVKGTSAITVGTQIGPFGQTQKALDRQYVSTGMAAGITFTSGSTTAKCYLMLREYAGTDNVDQTGVVIKIVSEDGSTVRATLYDNITFGGTYVGTVEFINNATHRNEAILDGDACGASYTTIIGDRLVVEIGYLLASGSGTTPEASAKWGENATDLPENRTQTTNGAGWIEFSNTITFIGERVSIAESTTATESANGTVPSAAINADVTESATSIESSDRLLTSIAASSEAGTATETENSTQTRAASQSESVTAIESQERTLVTLSSSTESSSATEVETALQDRQAEINESVTAIESIDATITNLSVDITESVTSQADQDGFKSTESDIAEPVTADHEQDFTLVHAAITVEAIFLVEDQEGTLSIQSEITEAATSSELASVLTELIASINEAVLASEITDCTLVKLGEVEEETTATDLIELVADLHVSVVENTTAIDSSATGNDELVQELANLVDIIDASSFYNVGVNEAASASDSLSLPASLKVWNGTSWQTIENINVRV